MIIHISGTPGSGKTTLGEELQKIYGNKIIVYDTDEFIQHHNKEGKKLIELEKTLSIEEYKKIWKEILHNKIEEFIIKNKDKIIVFTGILDNFSPDGTIYEIEADHKFMLDVPVNEILKRYYTRLCKNDQDYWNKVATQDYNINSSKEIINSNQKDIKWHIEHGYLLKNDKEIINKIDKIIKNSKGDSYYNKYLKYKPKYNNIKKTTTKSVTKKVVKK